MGPGPGRVRCLTVCIVGGLHLLALALVVAGHLAGGLALGGVVFAWTRGLLHAIDADHLSMIDGSTRKLLGEGRNPRGVGLAFSLGHSTVVMVAGVAVVLGSHWVRSAVDERTILAMVLGSIGAGVSSLYLVAVAAANVPLLVRALSAREPHPATGSDDHPGHSHPQAALSGWWSRALSAPLSRVRHAGHVYLFGLLFGLGFDTASTIAVLMLTAGLSLAGAPAVTLLAFPIAFAAAMTLGDSVNAHLMLRVYTAADTRGRRRVNIALLVLSIGSAVAVASVTAVELIGSLAGRPLPVPDTSRWGWALAAVALAGGLWVVGLRGRSHPTGSGPQPPR